MNNCHLNIIYVMLTLFNLLSCVHQYCIWLYIIMLLS